MSERLIQKIQSCDALIVNIIDMYNIHHLCMFFVTNIFEIQFLLKSQMHLKVWRHYIDVIMSATASHITGVSIVFSTVCWGADQRNPKALRHFLRQWSVDSLHKGPVTRKMFPFDDVIMKVRSVMISPSLLWAWMLVCCENQVFFRNAPHKDWVILNINSLGPNDAIWRLKSW